MVKDGVFFYQFQQIRQKTNAETPCGRVIGRTEGKLWFTDINSGSGQCSLVRSRYSYKQILKHSKKFNLRINWLAFIEETLWFGCDTWIAHLKTNIVQYSTSLISLIACETDVLFLIENC